MRTLLTAIAVVIRTVRRLAPGLAAPVLLAGVLLAVTPRADAGGDFEKMRRAMVADIRVIARSVGPVGGKSAIGAQVLGVMERVPRHLFVPEDMRSHAYEDRPLPIGYGQTISQPYIVAMMTDLLDLERGDAVLEVGTGSGYQAAVLAHLVRRVHTIEIVPELAEISARRFERQGYMSVSRRQGDGYYGWPEKAPFDAIVVTAAASHVPPPLIAQLKPGGRMIIPLGNAFFTQVLMIVEKGRDGAVRIRQLLPVRFVPLTGDH